ncbi:hypothetical protein WOLCODRAFT_152248 [Wolfiporia cocos MD-104 SS10]|uniref:Uncharacterized protein n=1 Tax=Wolfiporia cocos (strain MD-104) TaxID=742152 RepID=A0A2H3JK37_WOLCO|nr:hypothetical protein WOLCODRAFT_152248 [Wolfiporia cocos MD-104 SS10]
MLQQSDHARSLVDVRPAPGEQWQVCIWRRLRGCISPFAIRTVLVLVLAPSVEDVHDGAPDVPAAARMAVCGPVNTRRRAVGEAAQGGDAVVHSAATTC